MLDGRGADNSASFGGDIYDSSSQASGWDNSSAPSAADDDIPF